MDVFGLGEEAPLRSFDGSFQLSTCKNMELLQDENLAKLLMLSGSLINCETKLSDKYYPETRITFAKTCSLKEFTNK